MMKCKSEVITGLANYAGIDGIAQFVNIEDEEWESSKRALLRPPDTYFATVGNAGYFNLVTVCTELTSVVIFTGASLVRSKAVSVFSVTV